MKQELSKCCGVKAEMSEIDSEQDFFECSKCGKPFEPKPQEECEKCKTMTGICAACFMKRTPSSQEEDRTFAHPSGLRINGGLEEDIKEFFKDKKPPSSPEVKEEKKEFPKSKTERDWNKFIENQIEVKECECGFKKGKYRLGHHPDCSAYPAPSTSNWEEKLDNRFETFYIKTKPFTKNPFFYEPIRKTDLKSFIHSLLQATREESNKFYYNRGFLDGREEGYREGQEYHLVPEYMLHREDARQSTIKEIMEIVEELEKTLTYTYDRYDLWSNRESSGNIVKNYILSSLKSKLQSLTTPKDDK